MYTVQCTMYEYDFCIIDSLYITMNVWEDRWEVLDTGHTMYNVQCTLYTIHYTLCTLYSVQCSVNVFSNSIRVMVCYTMHRVPWLYIGGEIRVLWSRIELLR